MDRFENRPKCEIQAQSSLPVHHNCLEESDLSSFCTIFLWLSTTLPFSSSFYCCPFISITFCLHVLSFFVYSIFSITVFLLFKLFLLIFLLNSLSSPLSTKFILLLLQLQLFVTNNHTKVLTKG